MTTDTELDLRAGRRRVARSRGALSGILLLLLGLWAALIPLVGPYFNFGITPSPNDAFHLTKGRFWLEILPGGVAALAGLVLLLSASRVLTVTFAWLGALAGAWLVVGPTLAVELKLNAGSADPTLRRALQVLEGLLYFYAIGAAIVLVAGVALGRLSTHSVRDVRAAERRAAAEEAAAEEARVAEERRTAEAAELERHRAAEADRSGTDRRVDGERTDDDTTRRSAAGSEGYLGHHAPQHGGSAAPAQGDPGAYPPPQGGPVQGGPVQGGPVQGDPGGYPPPQGGPVQGGPGQGASIPPQTQQYPVEPAPPPPPQR